MTPFKKIIGTSIFSLLLVIVGLFMVCSGRVQQVQLEDDLFTQDASDEAYKDDLLKRLEVLEGEKGAQADSAMTSADSSNTTFAVTDSQPPVTNDAESFLTPELFQSMNAEVKQLEMLAANKDQAIDSLRAELEEKNYQYAALQTAAGTKKITGKPLFSASNNATYNSEYGMAYQDALDDFYVRRFDSAIRKFQALLQNNDRNELTDNCQYWIGECYYAMGNYYEAVAEFQKVYAFARSNKTPDAQLMIGLAFLKTGEKDMARAELNILLSFDPNSTSAKKAQRYLRMIDNA